ncbi:MAG: GWxTD domain-containing protein [Acidobacteriia bacterium]|nr:GWxTD domain-containing protein [Terriglobia bacterium]
MTLVERLVHTVWAAALGSALLHFLWQGALAAVVLALTLRLTRTGSARLRYAVACLAMLALPIVFGVTFWLALGEGLSRYPLLTHPRFPNPADAPASSAALPLPSNSWTAMLPWLTPFWMVGVVLLYLRSMAAWLAAQRLRSVGVCAAAVEWQERLRHLTQHLRLRRPVLLLESCLTDVPAVVGFFRPAILMPLGLLSGFPAEQVEAFLLHELAHIRRYDYVVNLAQSLVEGLLFYHPAVWWISRQVRAERENCCDDAVVALTGDARGYAAALATLEVQRWTAAEAALAATGGDLMKRIHRLLGKTPPSAAGGSVLGLLLISAGLVLAAWSPAPSAVRPQPPATDNVAVTSPPLAIQTPRLVAQSPAPQPRPAAQRQAPDERPLNQDVSYIITDEERAAWKRLSTDEERARFIEQLRQRPRLVAQSRPQAEDPNQKRLQEEKLQNELETPYQKWLSEDVAYIVTDEERAAFQRLQTDEEREQFIRQFWLRRDPTPGTPRNEYQEEHYRRIASANMRFGTAAGIPGWKTDRGRIYITFGPPDEIDAHPSGGPFHGDNVLYPFETWRYRYIGGIGNDVGIDFADAGRNGEFHMTRDPNGPDGGQRYVPAVPGGGRSGPPAPR